MDVKSASVSPNFKYRANFARKKLKKERNQLILLSIIFLGFLEIKRGCIIVKMFFRLPAHHWLSYFVVVLPFLVIMQRNLSVAEGKLHSTRDRRHRHGLDNVDSVFVINLETRSDRLHEINAVLGSLGIANHTIVKGIPHSCGALGCSLSHAMAVAECIDSNATTCAVFEDDFELVRDPREANAAIEIFFRTQPSSWEVLMFSANAISPSSHSKDFSHLSVVNAAFTASGYIVHRSFATTLLNIFLQAAFHLNESNCSKVEFAHDVLWLKLQQSGKWFSLKPLIGKQRASYSDIEKMNVDYKVKL